MVSSRRAGVIKRSSMEKPTSESNLSVGRRLSDLGLRSSNPENPSSPSQESNKVFPPNPRKRPSDDDSARLLNPHNRTLSGHESSFDRGQGTASQQSLLYDPARDTITSRASPPRMASVHGQSPKLSKAFYNSNARGINQASLAPQRGKLTSKQIFEPEKFYSSISSQQSKVFSERESGILLQPETRPITQEQLVSEVKGV